MSDTITFDNPSYPLWKAGYDAGVAAEREVSDKLEAALKSIVDLDDGDSPDLWHYESEFDSGRAALAEVAALRKGEKQ